jgi:hypothetical protein
MYSMQKVVTVPGSNEKQFFTVQIAKRNLTSDNIYDLTKSIKLRKYMYQVNESYVKFRLSFDEVKQDPGNLEKVESLHKVKSELRERIQSMKRAMGLNVHQSASEDEEVAALEQVINPVFKNEF